MFYLCLWVLLFSLQGTNRNMSPITAGKVDYHMTWLAPNNKPLTQLFPHI